MTQLDISFEEPAWSGILRRIPRGGSVSGGQLLTLLEGESQQTLEEALDYLMSTAITLDISDLPKPPATGQTGLRLRREEELVKAGALPQGLEENDPLRLYLEEVGQLDAPADLEKLAARYVGGYDNAIPLLTNGMLPTVIQLAYQRVGRGVLLMDLIQEGSLGLWQGILCYTQGNFREHACRWIGQYMDKIILLQAHQSGIGQKMRQAMEDYRQADEWLLSELGRNPTLEEIAHHIHLTVEEARSVADMLDAARLVEQSHPGEKQEQTADDPEQERAVEDTAYFQMRQRVAELLDRLSPKQAQLLTMRFGLEGGLPLSPEETGKALGMTPEEVVAQEAAALGILRNEG